MASKDSGLQPVQFRTEVPGVKIIGPQKVLVKADIRNRFRASSLSSKKRYVVTASGPDGFDPLGKRIHCTVASAFGTTGVAFETYLGQNFVSSRLASG